MRLVCREIVNSLPDPHSLYLLVKFGKEEFDVEATDGVNAWQASGCRCPASSVVGGDEWLKNAEGALVDGHEKYEFEVERKEDKGGLEVRWLWDVHGVGEGTRGRGRCWMMPVDSPREVIIGILRIACSSFDGMYRAAERVVREKKEMESRLQEVEEGFKDKIAWWEAREEELLRSCAALLNASRASQGASVVASGGERTCLDLCCEGGTVL